MKLDITREETIDIDVVDSGFIDDTIEIIVTVRDNEIPVLRFFPDGKVSYYPDAVKELGLEWSIPEDSD